MESKTERELRKAAEKWLLRHTFRNNARNPLRQLIAFLDQKAEIAFEAGITAYVAHCCDGPRYDEFDAKQAYRRWNAEQQEEDHGTGK